MSEFTEMLKRSTALVNMWEDTVLRDLFREFNIIRSVKSHPWLCGLVAPNGAKFTVRYVGGQWDVASWRHDRPLEQPEPYAYYLGDIAGMVAFVNREVDDASLSARRAQR